MTIKVLILDPSVLACARLSDMIESAPDLKALGVAQDVISAQAMIRTLTPDVLILNADLLRTAGSDSLDRLIRARSLPVIRTSADTGSQPRAASKQRGDRANDDSARSRDGGAAPQPYQVDDIRARIRAACAGSAWQADDAVSPAPTFLPSRAGFSPRLLAERVIAIGASTGGTEAIREVLCSLPGEMPPIVIVQHMPEAFTPSFARRLDSLSNVTVSEARGGELLQPGMAYLAPGHSHMRVKRSGGGYALELSREEPVNRHRPSVDVLFRSVAEQVRQNALGVILTGMGKDGAQGLLAMHHAGAWNIGQDEASCAVYGMPREAAEVGALDDVASLRDISGSLLARLRQLDKRAVSG